jgi:hypothetical protein
MTDDHKMYLQCNDNVFCNADAAMAANPFVNRIPEQLLEAYKKDFQMCFLPFVHRVPTPLNPSAIEVDYTVVLVRATKVDKPVLQS